VNPQHASITTNGPAGGQVVIWSSAADGTIITSENCSIASGSTFPIGITSVTCTNVDLYGHTTENGFSVTVNSAGPAAPTINCGADPGPVALGSACDMTLPDFRTIVTFTPTDGSVTIYQSPAPGTVVGPGVTVVTMKASNATDVATCTKNFTVTGNGPVAVADATNTVANTAKVFPTALLLANDSSPDGRGGLAVVGLSGLSGGGGGGSVVLGGGNVTYTPPANFVGQQTFYYTNQDCAGLASAGLVTVTVTHPANLLTVAAPFDSRVGNVATVHAVGLPGVTYKLQKATVLLNGAPTSWTTLTNPEATAAADAEGKVTLHDTNSTEANAFYRAAYIP